MEVEIRISFNTYLGRGSLGAVIHFKAVDELGFPSPSS
jgi:hypothetical protein